MGGCVCPSVWELPDDRALFGAALSVAPSRPELSSALGVLWGGGEVAGSRTQGSRKKPLSCPGDGRVDHRYSRHGFSWSRAVGGVARGQLLSSPGPTASKGLPGLNQLFWAMVWEDHEFSIQTSGWRRCRGWLLASCFLTLLWVLSWVTTGGQPQLLYVPSVWPQRAPQPGAVGGRDQGQPEPSESSQNPLQYPPAGFGECPSPWQHYLGLGGWGPAHSAWSVGMAMA